MVLERRRAAGGPEAPRAAVTLLELLAIAAAATAGIAWRRERLAFAAIGIALFLWTWPPFEALFSASLERPFPITAFPPKDADVIVVLGANLYPRDASQPDPLPGFNTYLRCQRAAWLYRNWKPAQLVVSGGPATGPVPATLADVMAGELEREGVPRSRMWLERESRTTYENAVNTARMLHARGIHRVVLVTEAFHMLRARDTFERQGLEVVPAPCAYRTARFHASWRAFLPNSREIVYNDENLHEWIARVWYKLSGKS